MGTNTTIQMLTPVAVSAEQLIVRRESIVFQPAIPAGAVESRGTIRATATILVIDMEKQSLRLTATSAGVAVSSQDFIPQNAIPDSDASKASLTVGSFGRLAAFAAKAKFST